MSKVVEIANVIGGRVIGNGDATVTSVASISTARQHDLVFVEDAKNLDNALNSAAASVIAGPFAEKTKTTKTLVIVDHPRLAFARAARMLQENASADSGIHPTAVVHPLATIGEGVAVGPNAVVGHAVIGRHTRIGAGCIIGDEVEMGDDCHIYPNATIYSGACLRNRVIVHAGVVLGSDGFGYVRDPRSGMHEKFPQIGRLEIEDDVEIGANSTIDRGALEVTRIGRGTKIDNLVHIGHNCLIGENVLIAAQAGFSGSITIENNVVIGGQVGVGEHARIQEGVLLGGQAGVLPKKVLRGKGVAFWGTPAKPLREYLKNLAVLAKLGRKAE